MIDDMQISPPHGFGVVTYPPGASYGPRELTDYELVWMIEGDAQYRWDSVTFDAPEGSMILCRPGVTDFFQWDKSRRTRHGFCHFSLTCLSSDLPAIADWPFVRLADDTEVLVPLFRYLLAEIAHGNTVRYQMTMQMFLMAFVTDPVSSAISRADVLPESVERACTYLYRQLEEHPQSEIRLRDMADAACVTPEHLCRLFKAATGHTPAQTVRLARLDRSVSLLARSNYAIGEIAMLCGFVNAFHFSRCFSQVFGMSPSACRSSMRAGAIPPPSLLVRRDQF